ncbi:MAG: SUMF1/EgtB/PvdO family nonheme iron enzyme [Lentimicrobiaceae bacterium]|nr:SUMF1/EgtB/PvdO family nonheme iron enzyme [Lentimicrobiaceae bacterium]
MKEENDLRIHQALQPGTVLCDGKYTIEKKIGEGGFGITYKALQSGLNRTVCIKEYFLAGRCIRATDDLTVCLQGINENLFEKYRQSFVKEAKLLATLHHPNIVEVIDVFDENGTSYMVMSYIEGKSLQSIVDSRRCISSDDGTISSNLQNGGDSTGRLSYQETVNYIAQISNAVAYIHERHILHRDIKPDNIMITVDYKAILIDFGSAREFEQDKTQVHTSMLTHGYAPTEQYTANSRKGSYTDIYALGATMYFLLTGQVPLEAAARLTESMAEPKELVSDIPDEANRTILKAMQIKAENRHQTIQDFMDDLRNEKPSTPIDPPPGGTSSNKKLWMGLIGGLIIVALLIVLILRVGKDGNGEIKYKTYDFTGMNVYPMVKVKGGGFIMGAEDTEDDCTPHNVMLSDFYIGQFEVSQGLWQKIMGNNPSKYQSEEKRDSLPVENVSFEEVLLFIKRLNERTGKKFSLPTEAQWEYAARGGNKSKGTVYAGTSYPNRIWFDKDNPVKLKFPPSVNELGIYQMSGNVAEWCLDYYNADFYKTSSDVRDPICISPNFAQDEPKHVVRGGSFNDENKDYVTVFYRECDNEARSYIGFRLVINQ